MGILFNPPEPNCNPSRTPAANVEGTDWRCGNCCCVPTAWKLTVPAAGRLLPERVGDFLLTRSDPHLATSCAWRSDPLDNTLFSGPMWRLRWGEVPDTVLINGERWIVESGDESPPGSPLFVFVHSGEGDDLNDYTWECLGRNTLNFQLLDGQTEDPGDPVSVTVEPF